MKKLISAVLILAVIGAGVYFAFFNKSDDEKIVDRLEAFETAYASGDLEGCLNCLDAKSRNALKGVSKLGSAFGYDVSDFFGGMFSLGVAKQDLKVKFNVKKIVYTDKTHATVTADVWTSEDYLTAESTEEVKFEMVKEDNDWFMIEDF